MVLVYRIVSIAVPNLASTIVINVVAVLVLNVAVSTVVLNYHRIVVVLFVVEKAVVVANLYNFRR